MSTLITVASLIIGVVAVLVAVSIGAAEVRRLREQTGDRSRLTSILGGLFFQ